MLKVFNKLNVEITCLGNHDLDYGIERMKDLVARTAPTKWLISNINVEGEPIGGLDTYEVREFGLNDGSRKIKIGYFGLAGPDWPDAMCPEVTEELQYSEFVDKGREYARMLRAAPHNVDLVIALTHMRIPKDRILAAEVAEIDFVLGGHDHSYATEVDKNTGAFVIKSGTDFEDFSDFEVIFDVSEGEFANANLRDTETIKHLYSPQKRMLVKVERVQITN